MVCDNCTEVKTVRITVVDGEMFHRCRADENSCVDGKACPDYIESCSCTNCHIKICAFYRGDLTSFCGCANLDGS